VTRNDRPGWAARTLCRVLGHKWITVWDGGPKAHGWPSLTCIRCHENAWRSVS
jgi:hypothetical protein